MIHVNKKVVVITGGNSGIGHATAKAFVAQGAEVIITGRRKDAVEKAAQEIGAVGFLADQSSIPDIEKLVAFITQEYKQVDTLFINAGVGIFSAVEKTNEALFDTVMNINFKGAFFTLSKFIPILKEGASVIFLSSNGVSLSLANTSIYTASKAALNAIMKIAAVELAPKKIRVNAVSPGPVLTPILNKEGLLDEVELASITNTLIKQIPLAKMGCAEDIAKMVIYLSSDDASFITGAEFLIDGGMVLQN